MSNKSYDAKVRVRNLQAELDMSSLGIKAVPQVLVEMLEEYAGGDKSIDLSQMDGMNLKYATAPCNRLRR